MIFTPRPWQPQILDHILKHKRCAVYLDMGGGKTACVLTALEQRHLMGDNVYPILVLGPLRVVRSVWKPEVEKWEHLKHLRVQNIVGEVGARQVALSQPADIYCTNYENLDWLCERLGNNWPFRAIIADESTRLKGFRLKQGTKRAQTLAKRSYLSEFFIELTGTPVPNGLLDLWGQLWFLDKGVRLGRTFSDFRNRWFESDYMGRTYTALGHSEKQIQEAIKDICLTVNAADYQPIDKPVRIVVPIAMPYSAKLIYKRFEKDLYAELVAGNIQAANAAAKSTKCLQIANGCAYTDRTGKVWEEIHTEKIEALRSIVEEAAGSPILVSCIFRCDRERLKKAFPRAKELDTEQETIDTWNAGKIPMLIAHPKSCGHGLNLQDGGHRIVFFNQGWDLEYHDQMIERIGPLRQIQNGYKRPVYVYYLISTGTLDEVVMDRLESKKEVQNCLLEALKRS